jgi:hypothetical protein
MFGGFQGVPIDLSTVLILTRRFAEPSVSGLFSRKSKDRLRFFGQNHPHLGCTLRGHRRSAINVPAENRSCPALMTVRFACGPWSPPHRSRSRSMGMAPSSWQSRSRQTGNGSHLDLAITRSDMGCSSRVENSITCPKSSSTKASRLFNCNLTTFSTQ